MDHRGNKVFHPDTLLLDYESLFTEAPLGGPVLDLACGDGHNGIFLASKGKARAQKAGVHVQLWQVDLEKDESNPLEEGFYGGILVFRYLHRALIPPIKKSLKSRGVLVYETYTVDQPQFGKPHNPHFLLKHGELSGWFEGWSILRDFEGVMDNPKRAVAQMVCRKPGEQRNDGILEQWNSGP
jgi:hypothetical protein